MRIVKARRIVPTERPEENEAGRKGLEQLLDLRDARLYRRYDLTTYTHELTTNLGEVYLVRVEGD